MANDNLIDGALVNNASNMALETISDDINVHTGGTATALTKPTTGKVRYLWIHVEVGNFRCQVGDTTGTIGSYAVPSADVTDGTGTRALEAGEKYLFAAPDTLTVIGENGSAVMTYSWV